MFISISLTCFASVSHTHTHFSPDLLTLHQALHTFCQSADGCVSQLSRWVVTTRSLELPQTETSLRLPLLSQFGYGQCQPQHHHYRQANQTRCQHGNQPRAVWSILHLWRITHTQARCCLMIPSAHTWQTPPEKHWLTTNNTHTNTQDYIQTGRKAVLHEVSDNL